MIPQSLTERLFLLSCDPATDRLTGRAKLGRLLRAAALVDLQLTGHLADADGRAQVLQAGAAPKDPVLARVLADLASSSPRKWRRWVNRHQRRIAGEVREELEQARQIKVEKYRRFWVVPAERITLRHPLVRRQLLQLATETLRPTQPAARVDLRDAALVVLASTAEVRLVISKQQRRQHKDRLAQLAARVGPVVPALRKAIQDAAASSAG